MEVPTVSFAGIRDRNSPAGRWCEMLQGVLRLGSGLAKPGRYSAQDDTRNPGLIASPYAPEYNP